MTAFDWREHIFQALSLLLPVHLDVYVLQVQVYCYKGNYIQDVTLHTEIIFIFYTLLDIHDV